MCRCAWQAGGQTLHFHEGQVSTSSQPTFEGNDDIEAVALCSSSSIEVSLHICHTVFRRRHGGGAVHSPFFLSHLLLRSRRSSAASWVRFRA